MLSHNVKANYTIFLEEQLLRCRTGVEHATTRKLTDAIS
jgi:uncharacterized protein (DUF2461 family)